MSSARLFYYTSERARRIIESYFLLNSTLHFSYTHLVCRTAITGQTQTQTPLAVVWDSQQLSAELFVRDTLERRALLSEQAASDPLFSQASKTTGVT